MNVTRNSLNAITSQFKRLSKSSAKIASPATFSIDEPKNTDSSDSIIDNAAIRIETGANIRANAAVIKTDDEMVGQLLDIIA